MAERRFDHNSLQKTAENIVVHRGVADDDAAVLANSLIYADLTGTSTHGISRLKIYMDRIDAGLIDPKAQPQVVKQTGSTAAIDANNCIGQVAGTFATERAIELCEQHGIGACTVRHSQHFGAARYYCKLAADAGVMGGALTNSESAMAPWGSYEPYFGTNPISLGCPTPREFPILIDLATSQVARGNIIAAAKAGEDIPDNWALDDKGNPTTDAEAALDGSVLPLGGVKGYALALLVDLLSGVLSGAGFGTGVGSMYDEFDREANVGHFFYAINPEAFMLMEEFNQRLEKMIQQIKSSGRSPNVDEIFVPGEIEFNTLKKRREDGIPLPPEVIEEVSQMASEAGLSWPDKKEA